MDGTSSSARTAIRRGNLPIMISCQNALATNFIYLGRGVNFAVALEGAMKCKEIAYLHAEG